MMKESFKSFKQRIKRIILLTVKKAMDPYFSGNSAEVAFFLLMSIVPTILLLAQILNLFDLSMDIIKRLIIEYADNNLADLLMPLLVDHNSSGALSFVLVILALWSGSKAIFALMRITNFAYLQGASSSNPVTGYFKERIRAILTVFIILFTLIFAIGILIYGRIIAEAVTTYLNEYLGENYTLGNIWLNVRWVLGFILYFFMVTSIYYLLPSSGYRYMKHVSKESLGKSLKYVIVSWLVNSRKTLKKIFPGSIFASIGMMVASGIYTLYLSHLSASNFNILYGSLGAAVLLLLWFYILAYVLVLGIQINSIWEESKENSDNFIETETEHE